MPFQPGLSHSSVGPIQCKACWPYRKGSPLGPPSWGALHIAAMEQGHAKLINPPPFLINNTAEWRIQYILPGHVIHLKGLESNRIENGEPNGTFPVAIPLLPPHPLAQLLLGVGFTLKCKGSFSLWGRSGVWSQMDLGWSPSSSLPSWWPRVGSDLPDMQLLYLLKGMMVSTYMFIMRMKHVGSV